MPGFSESPYYQVELTGIMRYLQTYKYIAAVPFGTALLPTATCCPLGASDEDCVGGKTLDKANPCSFNAGGCCGVAAERRVDDVEFAREVLEYMTEYECGDRSNAFATGFSNGGMMSNRLGCEASDAFRAVFPVAGNVREGGDLSRCAPTRSVGWLSFCGTEDSACNRDFEETAQAWAERNRCSAREPSPTYVTETTSCFGYHECDAHVEFCTLQSLGHEWPGHARPDGTSSPQPASNVDATAFIFDRMQSMVESGTPRATV